MIMFDEPLAAITFPYELDFLVMEGAEDGVPHAVSIAIDDTIILNANLYSKDGYIELTNIAELLNVFLTKPGQVKFIADGAVVGQTKTLPCRFQLDMPAEKFVATHFLTLAPEIQFAREQSKVYLSFLAEAKNYDMTITAVWIDRNDYSVSNKVQTKHISNSLQQIITTAISLQDFVPEQENLKLHRVIVEVGALKHIYEIKDYPHIAETQLEFVNAFGCVETIAFDAVTIEDDVNFAAQVNINGAARNIGPKTVSKYNFVANFITTLEKMAYRDLSTSTDIRTCADQLPLVIKNCNIKDNPSPFMSCSVDLKMETAEHHHRFSVPVPVRTFDMTFDNTFR